MSHDSRAIANKLVEIAADAGNTLTPMQLLKLVYICHGWMLGLYSAPLIRHQVQAWKYGPVIPELYKAIKSNRDQPVTGVIQVSAGEKLLPIEDDLLNQVYNIYGSRSGIALSRLTHEEGTPWAKVFDPNSYGVVIPSDLIEDHYKMLSERA